MWEFSSDIICLTKNKWNCYNESTDDQWRENCRYYCCWFHYGEWRDEWTKDIIYDGIQWCEGETSRNLDFQLNSKWKRGDYKWFKVDPLLLFVSRTHISREIFRIHSFSLYGGLDDHYHHFIHSLQMTFINEWKQKRKAMVRYDKERGGRSIYGLMMMKHPIEYIESDRGMRGWLDESNFLHCSAKYNINARFEYSVME